MFIIVQISSSHHAFCLCTLLSPEHDNPLGTARIAAAEKQCTILRGPSSYNPVCNYFCLPGVSLQAQ